jgi:DNA/RNA endonuclease YhcR with UshA esterase domain
MSKKFLTLILLALLILNLFPKISKAETVKLPFGYYFYPFDGTSTAGTPFGVFVNLSGGQPNTDYYVTGYFYYSTTSSGYIWHLQNNSWFATPGSTSLRPKITTDGNGNWKGWLVFKTNSSTNFGGPVNFRVRITLGSTNYDATLYTVNLMNMSTSGNGGWIEGYAYLDGNPAQGKIVVVKDSNNTIVGIYMTEDNGINENYGGGAGYFKVASPVGCNLKVELWDPVTNVVYVNGTVENICVNAGQTTSGININAFTNNPPVLEWTGESGYENDGVEPDGGNVSTTFEFRIKYVDQDNNPPLSGYPKVHILKEGAEITGSPFSMEEVDSNDTDYTDGKLYKFSTNLSAGNYSYYFEAKDEHNANATGEPTNLKSGPIVEGETIPPVIYELTPPRFSSNYNKKPTISAKYYDPEPSSGIDTSNIYLKIDGIDLTSDATITETQLTYTPTNDLSIGKHSVEIGVKDLSGNQNIVNYYFYIIEELTTPNFYFGVPHAHTSYSDGALTPQDAFTYARDVANIDFLAITDHSNWLDANEWTDTLNQAEAFTQDGIFVALRGFEYTHTTQGHINVYNTDTFVSRNDPNYDTLEEFYAWLKTQPNAIAQFNHPFTLDDFNGFAYDEILDSIITLQEVGNGSPPYSYARLENAYIYALDKGWHVGATNGQDNHTTNWGYPPNNLTGIIANNLTKNNVLDALKMMRTYSTEDRNLRLSFKANNYFMGSTIPVLNGEDIQFEIYAYDPDSSEKIVKVEIITNGGYILKSWTNNSQIFETTYTINYQGGSAWYYLRILEEDGDIGITSPIWTPPSDIDLKVISLSYSPKALFPNKQVTLKATLKNYGLISFSNLTVKFYEGDPQSGGVLIDTKTVNLPSGSQIETSTTWTPISSGLYTIYAILEPPQGDPEFDNMQKITFRVLESLGKRVLIDRYHKNDYTSTTGLYNLSEFADLLTYNGYEVIDSYQEITDQLLNGIDLLVITYPQSGTGKRDISDSEKQVIKNFVQNGGSLLFTAKSNYNEDPTRYNDFLVYLGLGININHDNIYDDVNNYGYLWGVNLYNFPETESKICEGIKNIRFFSGASLIKPDRTPLVSDPINKIEILAYANQTSYDEDDVGGANNHVGPGYYIYSYRSNPNGSNMPAMAVQTLPNGARVAVLGRAVFSNYELGNWVEGQAACNNDAFTLNLVDWLCKVDRVMPIAEARKDVDNNNVPDRLGERVTIRGVVTSGSGKFFDVIYLQDETGGITVFGSFPTDKIIPEGAILQVTGIIDQYNGDTELQFDDFYRDFLWIGWTDVPQAKYFRTGELNLEQNEGWLVKTEGFVTEIIDSGTCKIDDGSGEIIVFIDGYIGTLPQGLKVGDYLYVIGLSGEYSEGHRIRVRSPNDISFTPIYYDINLSIIGNGNVIINPPSGPYNPYTQITLTAIPTSGWYFVEWSGDIASTLNPLQINITKNLNIKALFVNSFVEKNIGAIILLDLVSNYSPRWRVIISSKNYDTGWMRFNRYKITGSSFWGEYADKRYHLGIDFTQPSRYHIIFDDRITKIQLKFQIKSKFICINKILKGYQNW